MSLATLGSTFASLYGPEEATQPAAALVGQKQAPSAAMPSDKLQALTAYIPGDVLTAYLAVIAAITAFGVSNSAAWGFWAFIACLCLTPAWAFLTVFMATPADPQTKKTYPRWQAYLWPMIAGTLAFAVYGLALPTGLLQNAPVQVHLAGTVGCIFLPMLLAQGEKVYIKMVPPSTPADAERAGGRFVPA